MNLRFLIKDIFSQPRKFFLENLGTKQTILKNTFWLALAEGISRFLKLFLLIYIARILGATEYGRFTFALAFAGLFGIFADPGLSQIVVREFSRDREKEKEFFSLISLKFFLSLFTLILIFAGSFFITADPFIRKLIWILAIFTIIESFGVIFFAFFQAREKMEVRAWTQIFEAILATGIGFFVLFYFPSVFNLSLAYLFSAFLALIFLIIFFSLKVFPLKLEFQKSVWQSYLKLSYPLALTGLFAIIYTNIDSTMLGYFGQITETGWYNAVKRIINVALIPAGLISLSFFPVLNKFLAESKEKLQRAWNYYLETMFFLALPTLFGGFLLASRIIDFVYDPSFFPAILAFQILLVMAALQIISIPFGQILLIFNQQNKIFWITLSGAILNTILNLVLIPKYSLNGAAFATVITVFLTTFLFFIFIQKFTPIKPFNFQLFLSLLGVIFSSIFMFFFISQPEIYQMNILIIISFAALIYGITFLGFKLALIKLVFDKIFKKF